MPRRDGESVTPATPNNNKSIRGRLIQIQSLTKWAVESNLLATNPLRGCKLPRDPQNRGHCHSPDEVQRLCAAAEGQFADILYFLACTGLRINELMWLTKSDIDLEARLVKSRNKVVPETAETWQVLKQGEARSIPLSGKVLDIARRRLQAPQGPWLFYAEATSRNPGGRFTEDRLRRMMQQVKQATGIKAGRFHAFRHAYCSYLASQGVPPVQLMKLMGHSTLSMVLVYCHAQDADLISAVDVADLSRLVTGKSTGAAADLVTDLAVNEK